MNAEQLRDLIRYRMEQASETLAEAVLLRDAAAFRGAVNRAYYAMFYAVLGLLATRQLGTSKHSGAIALFDREFVKTGIFSPELSRALHLASQPGRCTITARSFAPISISRTKASRMPNGSSPSSDHPLTLSANRKRWLRIVNG